MILVPRKNLYLPRRRWAGDPRKQRGSIQMAGLGMANRIQLRAGNGGTVSVFDGVSPYDSFVGIRFLTDGRVQTGNAVNGAAITWSDHGTWIDPQAQAGPDKRVRYTNRVGADDFTSKAAVEDTFIAISATRTWVWNETTLNSSSFDCDFEVDDNGGPLPTGSQGYTFQINNSA